jgi:thiol:disulfide interchange protein DsbC
MKRRFLPVLLAGMACLMSATYAAAADESLEEMTRLLKLRLGTDNVETPVETGIEGVYQTRFGNKFAYLIEGGRYIFIGDLVDLKLARNLTEASRRELIVEAIAGFSAEKQVVFPAEGEELAVLNVFTDTSCGYCQKLHTEVKYLQEAGISVHYIPYPRGGNRGPGYSDMRKVWCAEDKREAMSIAKKAEPGTLSASTDCATAAYVDEGYVLGNRIGVTGTPALFTSDGASFNGYVPYQQLIPQLLNQ